MPIVEPQAKHKYTAKIVIEVDHPDPVHAFQVGTELVQRIRQYGSYNDVEFRGPVIVQAEIERIEPEAVRDGR